MNENVLNALCNCFATLSHLTFFIIVNSILFWMILFISFHFCVYICVCVSQWKKWEFCCDARYKSTFPSLENWNNLHTSRNYRAQNYTIIFQLPQKIKKTTKKRHTHTHKRSVLAMHNNQQDEQGYVYLQWNFHYGKSLEKQSMLIFCWSNESFYSPTAATQHSHIQSTHINYSNGENSWKINYENGITKSLLPLSAWRCTQYTIHNGKKNRWSLLFVLLFVFSFSFITV